MMPTRNVHLTEHFDNFIEAEVRSGEFSNASEVVREGLRLLERRQEEDKAKLAWLRGAVQEGVDAAERGEYTALPNSSAVRDYLHRLRAR
jgi:antitoxin ParD1/3/4